MKDYFHIRCGCGAIVFRKKIARKQFDTRSVAAALAQFVDFREAAGGGPRETSNVAEAEIQQALYDSRPDEAARACHQD